MKKIIKDIFYCWVCYVGATVLIVSGMFLLIGLGIL